MKFSTKHIRGWQASINSNPVMNLIKRKKNCGRIKDYVFIFENERKLRNKKVEDLESEISTESVGSSLWTTRFLNSGLS